MIAVGITEENKEIEKLISCALKEKNIPFGKDFEDEKNRYIFMSEPFLKKCDIIINDSKKELKSADCFIYLYNSDNKAKACPKDSLVISYGLNSLATVTASSIDETEDALSFQYCLQREIVSFSGKKIEPQEFGVRLSSGTKIHSALAFVTFMLLCRL